ncbi:MAG: S8 family serine peptidase [Candidatus Zixiibacteriota bacterium]
MQRGMSLFIFTLILMIYSSSTKAQHYYDLDGKVPLSVDSNKIVLKFNPNLSQESIETLITSNERMISLLDDKQLCEEFKVISLSNKEDLGSFLDSLELTDWILIAEPYYHSEGYPMPVGETFVVGFEDFMSETDINSMSVKDNVEVVRKLYGFDNVWLLKKTKATQKRLLDIANEFHEGIETVFASPDFMGIYQPQEYSLFDYYRNKQDHLKKVIGELNVNTVWDFAGLTNSIKVAVIDDGVTDHIDLPSERITAGYDFLNMDDNPAPDQYSAHGMGCAGIIGASHSTDSGYYYNPMTFTGVFSLNPNSHIMPVKIFGEYDIPTSAEIAEAINFAWQNGAEILSCSWGRAVCLGDAPIDLAIRAAYYEGRDSLGCAIIFASGNSAPDLPGTVSHPACLPETFAVGAIDLYDDRWDYSQFGSMLDAVAPSGDICLQGEVYTLDQEWDNGYNPMIDSACGIYSVGWNCPIFQTNDRHINCHFGGTSAAAPIVSGIASLLLARKPNLTVDQIYDILRNSAVTELESGTITPPDYYYGYGRVDAYRAMLSITRGDANNDGSVNISDAVYINNKIFKGGPDPMPHMLTGDANCDGYTNVGDVTYIINLVFKGGPPPPCPCFEYGDYK